MNPELLRYVNDFGIELGGGVLLVTALGFFLAQKKSRNKFPPLSETHYPKDEPKPFDDTPENTLDSVISEIPTAPPNWSSIMRKTREKWFGISREGNIQRENLEEALLGADVGFKCSQELLNELDFTQNWPALQSLLAQRMASRFNEISSVEWPTKKNSPHVILVIGVNGVGKTTSIAKLARELKLKGKNVLLAAGDTFRAAAAEQLSAWAERIGVPCIRGGDNADSSAVLFDAIKAGMARNVDYVICDSAGRLHNNEQLMENLGKNRRVIEKALPGAPHDVILVLDANTGQNMLNQGKKFLELGLTALILTKIDGSAKGGAVIPLIQELKIPIVRLGVGEGDQDFLEFNSLSFSRALVGAPEI